MNVTEAQLFQNISASTSAFKLNGGRYALTVCATWGGGNVNLQTLGPDGSTWISPLNSTGFANSLLSNGQQIMDLPPGQYVIAVTTAIAVYATIASIPS